MPPGPPRCRLGRRNRPAAQLAPPAPPMRSESILRPPVRPRAVAMRAGLPAYRTVLRARHAASCAVCARRGGVSPPPAPARRASVGPESPRCARGGADAQGRRLRFWPSVRRPRACGGTVAARGREGVPPIRPDRPNAPAPHPSTRRTSRRCPPSRVPPPSRQSPRPSRSPQPRPGRPGPARPAGRLPGS